MNARLMLQYCLVPSRHRLASINFARGKPSPTSAGRRHVIHRVTRHLWQLHHEYTSRPSYLQAQARQWDLPSGKQVVWVTLEETHALGLRGPMPLLRLGRRLPQAHEEDNLQRQHLHLRSCSPRHWGRRPQQAELSGARPHVPRLPLQAWPPMRHSGVRHTMSAKTPAYQLARPCSQC